MNGIGGAGGSVGGPPTMNMGTPGTAPGGNGDNRTKLHTYIYDYFLKNQMYDLARMFIEKVDVEQAPGPKQSPHRKEVNGDTMDEDSKDNLHNKPDDLPLAGIPGDSNGSFLFDWWNQFWDIYAAQRSKGSSSATKQYLNHAQQQAQLQRERNRMMSNPQMQGNMNMRNPMMQGAMGVPNKVGAMGGNRQPTPQQLQQMHQMQMQQRMMQQNQMQREGSAMDGQNRPQTPGSGENAPSPKRQRIDGGSFNGQMGPMGRGQPQGMQGQQVGSIDPGLQYMLEATGHDLGSLPDSQFNTLSMQQSPAVQAKSVQVYADSMRQQMQDAIDSNAQKGMPNPNGLPQGSPAMAADTEFFGSNQIRGIPGPGGPNANNSNHALQDYQMQLMLLEQQNKKRLLMARQEQETVPNGPGGPVPGQFAPAISPSNSRTGPSPNPDQQAQRGTPKMGPGGMPLPNPDGSMPQGRGSPVPGFDHTQMNPNMPPQMFNAQMAKMGGMMGPNGQMMQQMHPAAMMNGQMTAQQLDFMRQQQMNGQRPNGPWAQGPPPGMMPGQPQQPNMTPQQRNAAMPPPPAPAPENAARTQPSSPSQSAAAPPTPSQTNKPNPQKKKDGAKNNKKASAKKGGATAATPASEAGEQPPTPTPAPPITPTAPPQQFNKNNGNQAANAHPQGVQNVMHGQQPHDMVSQPFGNIESTEPFGLEFGSLEGPDLLENFDFDAFLTTGDESAFQFDAGMGFADGGLEAGGDV